MLDIYKYEVRRREGSCRIGLHDHVHQKRKDKFYGGPVVQFPIFVLLFYFRFSPVWFLDFRFSPVLIFDSHRLVFGFSIFTRSDFRYLWSAVCAKITANGTIYIYRVVYINTAGDICKVQEV